MLMLLNSRSVMKGSLRDLIEVSVGQTRGVPSSLAFYSPAIHSWHGEGGRRLFFGSCPQADRKARGVSDISSKMRVQCQVWAGGNSEDLW